jgi:hypothetical protein
MAGERQNCRERVGSCFTCADETNEWKWNSVNVEELKGMSRKLIIMSRKKGYDLVGICTYEFQGIVHIEPARGDEFRARACNCRYCLRLPQV